MTTNLDRKPTLEQILKAAPMLCRASIDVEHTLAATLPDGTAITEAEIDGLLEKCRLGQRVAIDVPMLAYEQWDYEKFPGKDNRNFVCFRGGEMRALGGTGKRKPFLRDHEQRDSLARGGTLVQSKTEQPEEGHYQIFQTVRLTAPWAVEMYLRGLMTTVSIGWHPTGPVLCSACAAPIGEKCWHWPGDRLDEVTGEDGVKRKVRNRSGGGAILVRWIYTKAELIETSCVPVPGVPTAEMDQLRATLSAQFPALALDDISDEQSAREQLSLPIVQGKSTPCEAGANVDPQPETIMADQQPAADHTKQLATLRKALAAALALPEAHRAYAQKLSADDADAFLGKSDGEREADVQAALAADPVVFTGELTKRVVRRSHGELAKQLAEDNERITAESKRNADELAAARQARETAEVASICKTKLSSLPGSDEVHQHIVATLRAAGGPLAELAIKALADASTNIAKQSRAPGANLDEDAQPEDAMGAWNRALEAYATKHNIADRGEAAERFLSTREGREAKRAYDDATANRKQANGR